MRPPIPDRTLEPDPQSRAGRTAGLPPDARWHTAEQVLCSVVLIAVGARQFFPLSSYSGYGVTSGYLLAFACLPVWVRVLRNYTSARLLAATGLFALACGLLLVWDSSATHALSRPDLSTTVALLVGSLLGIGVVLWGRVVLPPRAVPLLFGLGMFIDGATGAGRFSPDPWKFAWGVPVAVITLSLVAGTGRQWSQLLALLALAAVSAAFDSRSYFAAFLFSAVLILWQMRPGSATRGSWASTAVLLAATGAAIYFLGTQLLVEGALGAQTQARSLEQIRQAGSLLLGGRPELAATIALFLYRPFGFGPGVVPAYSDISAAKAGMLRINYDPNNGYVDTYLFGTHIELHSTLGDLWSAFGVGGIAVAGVVLAVTVRGTAEAIARRCATGLMVFLASWSLWNLFFSPFYASASTLVLATGLLLRARKKPPRLLPAPPNGLNPS